MAMFEMNLFESTMDCNTTMPNNYVRNVLVLVENATKGSYIIDEINYLILQNIGTGIGKAIFMSSIKSNKTCHYNILYCTIGTTQNILWKKFSCKWTRIEMYIGVKSDLYGNQKQMECYYNICLCIESCEDYCHYQKRLFLMVPILEFNREW